MQRFRKMQSSGDAQSVYPLPVPCDGGTNTVLIALFLYWLPSWLQRLAMGRSSATGASPRLWASSSPPEGAVASGLLVSIVARMSSEIRSFCSENNTEIRFIDCFAHTKNTSFVTLTKKIKRPKRCRFMPDVLPPLVVRIAPIDCVTQNDMRARSHLPPENKICQPWATLTGTKPTSAEASGEDDVAT